MKNVLKPYMILEIELSNHSELYVTYSGFISYNSCRSIVQEKSSGTYILKSLNLKKAIFLVYRIEKRHFILIINQCDLINTIDTTLPEYIIQYIHINAIQPTYLLKFLLFIHIHSMNLFFIQYIFSLVT